MLSLATLIDSVDGLADVHRSLAEQSDEDWEWLLVPAARGQIPARWSEDPRVRILEPSPFVLAQGEVGHRIFAFEQAAGTYVMELGRKESLHTEAVATMRRAIETSGADLLYPDFAPASTEEYDARYGWNTYEVGSDGARKTVVEAFDPEPSALHQAAFAPRVGLTWKRSVFLALDGPDPNVEGAADFDLVCRAYTHGLVLRRAPGCVVFTGPEQEQSRDRAAESAVSDRYAHQIVDQWCRREGLDTLDLGRGDMRAALARDEGTIGCIRAYDILNRIPPCAGLGCRHGADGIVPCVVGAVNHMYRVLAPGGWLITDTPSSDGRAAFQNPTYRSFWNPNSFWYYTRRDYAATVPGLECRFQAARVWQSYPTAEHQANHELRVHADLVALKGQRQPGPCEI